MSSANNEGRGGRRGRGRGRIGRCGSGALAAKLKAEFSNKRCNFEINQRSVAKQLAASLKKPEAGPRLTDIKRIYLSATQPKKRRMQSSPEPQPSTFAGVAAPASGYDNVDEPPAGLSHARCPIDDDQFDKPAADTMASSHDFDLQNSEFTIPSFELSVKVEKLDADSTREGTPIGKDDENVNVKYEEWLVGQLSDEDADDLPENDGTILLPVVTLRNSLTDPVCEADMTAFQIHVLRAEDEINDNAMRQIAPSDCYNFIWKNDKNYFTGQREVFSGIQGSTFTVTDDITAVDVFQLMFNVDLMDLLCTETNRYANQKLRQTTDMPPSSRLRRWKETDRDEMVSFLAVMILQGLYPLTQEDRYFSFNGFGTMQYFKMIMSYNRYALLKLMLHFVDNDKIVDPSKLSKIQPVIDYLNEKFSILYYPSQEIVIHESLLKWSGRLSYDRKISSKAGHVGFKTYELCEASSGYLWKFFVYPGKQTD